MTTVKESTLAKVVAGVAGFSAGLFMLGLMNFAPAAQAQTKAELQSQIQDLLETINNLQAQVDGQNQGSTGADPYNNCDSSVWLSDLSQGDRGQSVMALQQFLNMSADTRVAASGPGSPGQETSYYGPLTAQAVTDFQNKYSAEVLAPLNLTSGTGYWGAGSRDQARHLCETNVGADDGTDDGDTDDGDTDTDEDEDELEGGEASLEDFNLDNGSDSNLEEGDSGEVAEFEFDVENGDVRVSRADLAFRSAEWDGNDYPSGMTGDEEPWDVFEEVTLLDADGDEVASTDVDDEDNWLDDDHGDDGYYEVRFTDLNDVVREGDTAEYTIAVEVASNVDDADQTLEWEVNTLEDSVRVMDGENINHYVPRSDESPVDFDIEEEGQGEDLEVNRSSEDPGQAILPVEEDSRSDEYGMFAFDMEADDNDIELDEAQVNVDFTGDNAESPANDAEYNDVVSDAYLEIDGEEFDVDNVDVGNASTTDGASTSTLTFDIDGDYTVEEDEEVTAFLFLEFEGTNGNYTEGVTVQGSVEDGAVEGEGADDVSSTGDVSGDEHTLLVSGIYSDSPADTSTNSTDSNIQYEFELDLTAFENDAFLSTSTTNTSADAFNFSISNDNGTTTTVDVVSTAQEESGAFVIDEGATETFTVTIFYNASDNTTGHRVTLDAVNFSQTNDSNLTDEQYPLTPSADYRSSLVSEGSSN